MWKHLILTVVIGLSFLSAADVQNIEKLQAEKQALELKLEAYALKKKIIELENFIEQDKIEKEEKAERERALIRYSTAMSSALVPEFNSTAIAAAILLDSSLSSWEDSVAMALPVPFVAISFLPKRLRLCSIKEFAALMMGSVER